MPDRPKLIPVRPKHATKPRGTTSQRGYGTAHQKVRHWFLVEHPICQRCENGFSTDLHHKDRNPFNRDRSNLVALCEVCHRAEHGN